MRLKAVCSPVSEIERKLPRGLTTVYADARVRLYIRSVCGPSARKPMIPLQFRPSLSGKQSGGNPDISRFFNVPSELSYLGSKQPLRASFDVHFGSEAGLAPAPDSAKNGRQPTMSLTPRGLSNKATGNRVKVADHVVRPTQRNEILRRLTAKRIRRTPVPFERHFSIASDPVGGC